MGKLDYRLTIKVDGKPLSDSDLDDVVEVTVDTDCFLPAMFDITLEDEFNSRHSALSYVDGELFKIGSKVVISIDSTLDVENETLKGVLIDGDVTSLEPVFGSDYRALLHVRGYDRAHKLMSGENTRVFGSGADNSTNEQQIISKIASEAGLSSQIDSSGISGLNYTYVIQYAQTDWDFLWERARRVGYQVYVEGSSLYYRKANAPRAAGGPINLEWGKDLTSFEPRLSIMGQATESIVNGWDPATKKKVQGKCSDPTLDTAAETGLTEKPAQSVKKVYSKKLMAGAGGSELTAGLAGKLADARLSSQANNLVQASGYLQYGDPRVLAGRKVKVTGVGKKFSGTYYVTRARHTITDGGYAVHFDVSGTTAHTLYGLLNSEPGRGAANRITGGVVVGVVTSNNDPQKLGRVQVKFPWMPDANGAELASNWARPACPGAGKDRGMVFLPEVDDEVLVAFEHGDPNAPYILGGLWNKKDTLPKGNGGELLEQKNVNQRVIRSRSGHLVILDDKSGNERILVQDKSGENSILIDTAKNSITMKSKADFTIEAGGKFVVNAKGDIALNAVGKFDIDTKKGFTANAVQEALLKVTSSKLSISPSAVELAGLTVDVKANAKVSVSGSAMAEIKGGLVKIN